MISLNNSNLATSLNYYFPEPLKPEPKPEPLHKLGSNVYRVRLALHYILYNIILFHVNSASSRMQKKVLFLEGLAGSMVDL